MPQCDPEVAQLARVLMCGRRLLTGNRSCVVSRTGHVVLLRLCCELARVFDHH